MEKSMVAAALTAALLAGVAAVPLAQASPITVTDIEIPINETVNINNIDPAAPQQVYAGQNVMTTSTAQTIFAWCVDLFHDVGLGRNNYTFDEVPFVAGATDNATPTAHPLTAAVVGKLGGLFQIGSAILQSGELSAFNGHYGTAGTAADWSAAIQLAVWDTEYQDNYGALDWSGGSTTSETRDVYNALVADEFDQQSRLRTVGDQRATELWRR